MKIKFIIPVMVMIAAVTVGCGGGGGDTLDAKKAQLLALQTQLQETKKQIMVLENEIQSLDPSAKKAEPVVNVSVSTLEPGVFKHFVQAQGQVESNNNVMVSPKMGGTITAVYVKTGQNVSAGQTLAQVDKTVMEASLAELQLQLDLATTVYNKQKNLWDQQIGSEIQYLEAKNRKESLEKRIATTEKQIALTRITTPISGTVDNVMVKVGEAAAPGMPSFQVINLNDMKFTTSISESYIPFVKEGDAVSIEFPAIGKTIEGKINSVAKTINPVNRTVGLEVKLPRDAKLKANLTGEISINDVTEEDVITVPLTYVQESGAGKFVMVAERNDEGKWIAKKAAVETGLRYKDKVIVKSGLEKGQIMITQGGRNLEEGQLIKFGGMPAETDQPAGAEKPAKASETPEKPAS